MLTPSWPDEAPLYWSQLGPAFSFLVSPQDIDVKPTRASPRALRRLTKPGTISPGPSVNLPCS